MGNLCDCCDCEPEASNGVTGKPVQGKPIQAKPKVVSRDNMMVFGRYDQYDGPNDPRPDTFGALTLI